MREGIAESRPARTRGLKHIGLNMLPPISVASRADAWIETSDIAADTWKPPGRVPRGRVD